MANLGLKRLIAEVAARHGILLRENDPALAIVTLNQLVLQAVANDLLQNVGTLAGEFRKAADSIQAHAGAAIANEVRAAMDFGRTALRADLEAGGFQARQLVMEVHRAHSRPAAIRWVVVGLLAGMALLLCGMLLGKLML